MEKSFEMVENDVILNDIKSFHIGKQAKEVFFYCVNLILEGGGDVSIDVEEKKDSYIIGLRPISKDSCPFKFVLSKLSEEWLYLSISVEYNGFSFLFAESSEFGSSSPSEVLDIREEIDEFLSMKVKISEIAFCKSNELQKITIDVYNNINNGDEGFYQEIKLKAKFPWEKTYTKVVNLYSSWL